MKEVEDMKKAILQHQSIRKAMDERIILAKEQVDRTRKEKRDISNRPK